MIRKISSFITQGAVILLICATGIMLTRCSGEPLGPSSMHSTLTSTAVSPTSSQTTITPTTTTPTTGTPTATITPLARGLRAPSSLALYGDYIYWTDYYDQKIYRILKTGGSVQTIVGSGLNYPFVMTIYNNYIYVGEANPNQPAANVNRIMKTGVDSGFSPVALYSDQYSVGGITSSSNGVYWSEHIATYGRVKRGALDGTTPANTLAQGLNNPGCVITWLNYVFFAEQGTSPDGIKSNADGTVKRTGAADSNIVILATNLLCPTSLDANSTQVFMSEGGTFSGTTILGSVKKSLQTTLGASNIVVGANRITSIWFDSTTNRIYYCESDGSANATGFIKWVPVTGGIPITVADGQMNPEDIVMDSLYLYWIQANWNGNAASIMRRER